MTNISACEAVYIWREVAFPLWREVRPQFEAFVEVKKIILRYTSWAVETNYEELLRSGDRAAWLRWTLNVPIAEEQREKIQKDLLELFGEPSKDFRWAGTRTIVTMGSVVALGQYIQ